MKIKLHIKKKLFFFVHIGFFTISAFTQTNVENFDYPVSTLLTDNTIGFTEKTNTPSISIFNSGLEYSGLAVSGVGNAAHINISEGGDPFGPERIATKSFFSSSVNSGTVYLSFLANIKSTIGGDFNNFFIALSDFNSDRLRGRVMAKDDGNGKVQFGFTKGFSSDINWTTDLFDYNKTYFFVVKYEFVAGDSNDLASLFIFDEPVDGVPASEPASATLTANDISSSDLSNIKILHLRQRKVEALVDGLSLGTSWTDVVVESTLSVGSILKNKNALKVFQSADGQYLHVDVEGDYLLGNNEVRIYNVNGQLIFNRQIDGNQNKFTIDTNKRLTRGVYILNVNTPKNNFNKKFIIK